MNFNYKFFQIMAPVLFKILQNHLNCIIQIKILVNLVEMSLAGMSKKFSTYVHSSVNSLFVPETDQIKTLLKKLLCVVHN